MAVDRVTGPDSEFAVTFFANHAAARKTEGHWSLVSLSRRIETQTAPQKAICHG